MEKSLKNYHNPVMLMQSIDALAIKSDGIYVDLTFGGGGHAGQILNRLGKNGKLYAFDQDGDAKSNVPDDPRFTFINHNFKYLSNHLRLYGVLQVDGIFGDLGVSSHQFDTEARGFSTRMDCPLDMRMDTRKGQTAADILNTYSAEELMSVFRKYGEIPNAGKLAKLIVAEREKEPFLTSKNLLNRIQTCMPLHKEYKYAAQLYQALRIEVNDELDALQSLLNQSVTLIKTGGRLVIISYHSLEDRMVKYFMRSGNMEGKVEKDFYGNSLSPWILITHKPLTPDEQELSDNNRSRSARLRIAERR
ncbi:MAG: 16S rRNA (cytosine(1402)-N(4))-methyltransferase RsmH [Bacteroidales bacterium]|jgi:16S rRNA (cytosine1402-N4)-methyltransferase|nr:16S rRNA (cytosine(1402)-N(4))-methyltransferase RsmH [Bacteroidales bacterium]